MKITNRYLSCISTIVLFANVTAMEVCPFCGGSVDYGNMSGRVFRQEEYEECRCEENCFSPISEKESSPSPSPTETAVFSSIPQEAPSLFPASEVTSTQTKHETSSLLETISPEKFLLNSGLVYKSMGKFIIRFDCALTAEKASVLEHYLRTTETIFIGDCGEQILWLFGILKENTNLQHLYLRRNAIKGVNEQKSLVNAEVESLCDVLKAHTQLKIFAINHCPSIGAENLKKIFSILQDFDSLIVIEIRSCGISNGTATDLYEKIPLSLKVFNLSGNPINQLTILNILTLPPECIFRSKNLELMKLLPENHPYIEYINQFMDKKRKWHEAESSKRKNEILAELEKMRIELIIRINKEARSKNASPFASRTHCSLLPQVLPPPDAYSSKASVQKKARLSSDTDIPKNK